MEGFEQDAVVFEVVLLTQALELVGEQFGLDGSTSGEVLVIGDGQSAVAVRRRGIL